MTTPFIPQNQREILDPAIETLFESIRSLESDNDDIENSIDNNVSYIIMKILTRLYTYNPIAYSSAIGVLDITKYQFIDHFVKSNLDQSRFDLGDIHD